MEYGSVVSTTHINHVRGQPFRISFTESLTLPRSVLKELQEHARRIEEIIATLEELSDREGLRRIRAGLNEYEQRRYVVVKDAEKIIELVRD